MSELKRCPFCGGHMRWNDNEFESAYVCDDCHYFIEWDGMLEEFVKWWNTRPIEDALNKRIAELEESQRWIPVSERLPDIEDGDSKDYDVVLTYPFRRDVIVATWSYDALDTANRRRGFDCSSDEWGSDDITEYVTHWRERPTPPEVQE